MARAIVMLVALAMAGCGGREPTSGQLRPEPLTQVTWSIASDDDVKCPGASTRHDYTATGVHVVFCTWACGRYSATMRGVPDADHALVTLELGHMPGGWEILGEDVQSQGRCL